MMDKSPPYNTDAESAVVGSLLIAPEAIEQVIDILKPTDFFREQNGWLYEACVNLYRAGGVIDRVTVAHELARMGRLADVGGVGYLLELVSYVPTSVHARYYAQIVSRLAVMRGLISVSGQIAALGYQAGSNVQTTLSRAQDILLSVAPVANNSLITPKGRAEIASGLFSSTPSPVLLTGFMDIDETTAGIKPGENWIIAARPGIGKTQVVLQIAHNNAMQERWVLLVSAEMGVEAVLAREITSEANIPMGNLRRGIPLSEEQEQAYMDTVGVVAELPIWQLDCKEGPITTDAIMRAAKQMLMTDSLDLIIVDYIQLLADLPNRSRYERVSEISQRLKHICRHLNVPMISVSQLSRATEKSAWGDVKIRKPVLSDLRESGQLEQDADGVLALHRWDKYYTQDEWVAKFDAPYPKHILEVQVLKHRQMGDVVGKEIKLVWLPQSHRYGDYSRESFTECVLAPPGQGCEGLG